MYKVKLLDLPRNIDYLKIKDTYIFNELYVNGIDCAKLLARIIERGNLKANKVVSKWIVTEEQLKNFIDGVEEDGKSKRN